eukprot:scaffold75432_cov59-Cyclotella_meneghiniana.AAC.1
MLHAAIAKALQEVLKMMEVSCSCIAVVLRRQLSLRNLGHDSHTTSLASSDGGKILLAIRPQRAHIDCDSKGVLPFNTAYREPRKSRDFAVLAVLAVFSRYSRYFRGTFSSTSRYSRGTFA